MLFVTTVFSPNIPTASFPIFIFPLFDTEVTFLPYIATAELSISPVYAPFPTSIDELFIIVPFSPYIPILESPVSWIVPLFTVVPVPVLIIPLFFIVEELIFPE